MFGYEEALGYAVGDVVRDKDGISAASPCCRWLATARASGQSLLDRWDALARGHGVHLTTQVTLHAPSPAGIIGRLRPLPRPRCRPAGDRRRGPGRTGRSRRRSRCGRQAWRGPGTGPATRRGALTGCPEPGW